MISVKGLKILLRNQMSKVESIIPASFSMHGEDIVVQDLIERFQLGTKGFYVDLGAYHPNLWSNTYILYLMGWRGLNVDANQEVINLYAQTRPEDINVTAGVSDRNEMLTFHHVGFGLGSSFSREWVEHIVKTQRKKIIWSRPVQCYHVNELLEKYVPANQAIDLLDIDIESFDEKVFESYDLERFRPKIILAEIIADSVRDVLKHTIYKHLERAEFEMLSYVGGTGIFVDSRFQASLKKKNAGG